MKVSRDATAWGNLKRLMVGMDGGGFGSRENTNRNMCEKENICTRKYRLSHI